MRTPPQERGQDIYAVQQFTMAPEPTPAEPWPPPEGEPPLGYSVSLDGSYWVPDLYLNWGTPTYRPPVSWAGSPGRHDASPVG